MTSGRTYFRLERRGRDPDELLDPENQTSEPWGGTVYGRCDKCGGDGTTEHECESCVADGADPSCPACAGRVRYEAECPACGGGGEITESERDGVSVFPTEEGLYRYMARRRRGDDLEGSLVVELEGDPSSDDDFDADEGALLVMPTRIIAVRPLDQARLERG